MDIDLLRLTFDAKAKLATPGLNSQSRWNCASHRDAVMAAHLSRLTAGAVSAGRLKRGCPLKSGPPTHQGRVMLKTREKYSVLNWPMSSEPVRMDSVENSPMLPMRLAWTS